MQKIKTTTALPSYFILASLFLISTLNTATALPKIEYWETPENASVYYIHTQQIPMVDIQIALPAGSQDEKDQYGLADHTAQLMMAGTTDKPQEILLSDIEDLGADINFMAGTTRTIASLRSLASEDNLKSSLAIFMDVLKNPSFPETQFNLNIKTQLLALESIKEDAGALASEAFMKALYPELLQGVDSKQLKESLPKLTLDNIKNFYKRHYHANGASIILVGDINPEQAKEISMTLSAHLGKGESQEKYEYPTSEDTNQTIHLPFTGPQAEIILGQNSITRDHPDYFSLVLGNHILGGSGMTSLLFNEVREKEGLTYNISSRVNNSDLPGPFMVSFATSKEKIQEAIELTIKTIENFIKNGPSEEELSLAKNNILGGFALNLASNQQLANALLTISRYKLPLDYLETYPDKIKAISAQQIQEAFSRHIQPKNFTQVIVSEEDKKAADESKTTK